MTTGRHYRCAGGVVTGLLRSKCAPPCKIIVRMEGRNAVAISMFLACCPSASALHPARLPSDNGERPFRLRIRNDGYGIPPEMLETGRSGHYGLSGMRERTRKAGARLDIWSGEGTGTEIDSSIPASIACGQLSKRSRLQLFGKRVG